MPTTVDPVSTSRTLRAYAEHFEPHDWNYTRHHKIKRITHVPSVGRDGKTHRDYDHFLMRCRRAAAYVFTGANNLFGLEWRVSRFRMARAALRSKNLPDGILDEGSIITYWEETGEYLQFVQPSVGSLIADFLEQDPDNPHARLIAAEMDRIQTRYHERLGEDANEVPS